MIAALARRLRLLIGRAVITAIRDELKMQELQLTALDGETLDNVERFEEYGLTSRPLAGAEAVIAAVAGVRDHAVVVALGDRRHRPRGVLGAGDVALYTDQDSETATHSSAAHRLVMQSSGKKLIGRFDEFDLKTAGGAQVIGNASSLTLKFGSKTIVIDSSGVTIEGKLFLTHTHTGVQAGGSNTGGVT